MSISQRTRHSTGNTSAVVTSSQLNLTAKSSNPSSSTNKTSNALHQWRQRHLSKRLSELDSDNLNPVLKRVTRNDNDESVSESEVEMRLAKKRKKSQQKGNRRKKPTQISHSGETLSTFDAILQHDEIRSDNGPNYITQQVSLASDLGIPQRRFCEVCGYFAKYKCVKCQNVYCGFSCERTHLETLCSQFV